MSGLLLATENDIITSTVVKSPGSLGDGAAKQNITSSKTSLKPSFLEQGAYQSGCAVLKVQLSNFRNYNKLSLNLTAPVIVLSGANGAGKTNLLEALSFLSPGRGMRRARLRDVLRIGTKAGNGIPLTKNATWAVAATVYGSRGRANLGSSLTTTDGGMDRRAARLDGQAVTPASLSQAVGVQWLTPQMDRVFAEGASSRRRFLDRLVLGLDPEHGRRVSSYERSLRERAKILRDGTSDPEWLFVLEARMAADGVAVAAARCETVECLQRFLVKKPNEFPIPQLSILGLLEGWLEHLPAVEVESRFAELLRKSRPRDAQGSGLSDGPHRVDLAVSHMTKGLPAGQCSTGEQKALLISIVLANARVEAEKRGCAPILLLDEVVAHLDSDRRLALLEEILALGGQAWLTGTNHGLFKTLSHQAEFITIDHGRAVMHGNSGG